jgi:hypothetical protein
LALPRPQKIWGANSSLEFERLSLSLFVCLYPLHVDCVWFRAWKGETNGIGRWGQGRKANIRSNNLYRNPIEKQIPPSHYQKSTLHQDADFKKVGNRGPSLLMSKLISEKKKKTPIGARQTHSSIKYQMRRDFDALTGRICRQPRR